MQFSELTIPADDQQRIVWVGLGLGRCHEKLHVLFSAHFRREDVDPPGILVRTWRRLFGWAYGISTLESTLLFVFSGCVLALGCYTICFRYTQCCDAISDL